MIPSDYSSYFATMAAVSATLFGLIFLAVSITPESLTAGAAPLERQLKSTAAYLALANPLIISLFALLPHQDIGPAVVAVAGTGLLDMLGMAVRLFRNPAERPATLRSSLFILAGLILYGLPAQAGVRLLQAPSDAGAVYILAVLMIFVIVSGVARAWELVGGHRFPLREWLTTTHKASHNDAPRHDDPRQTGGR